jgi:hypothetical protein
LIFGLDATASRQPTWDIAAGITAEMFREAASIGGLEIQLCYFRGGEFRPFEWTSSAARVTAFMGSLRCQTGQTQIHRVLAHAEIETMKRKVGALVFVGDAIEHFHDNPEALRKAARSLGAAKVPVFMFQEGDSADVQRVFADIAALSGGAYARFSQGAAKELAAMLNAAAAFAAGGAAALAARGDQASVLLLGQMRKE